MSTFGDLGSDFRDLSGEKKRHNSLSLTFWFLYMRVDYAC